MPVDRICSLLMDPRKAQRLMDLVHGLYLCGALESEWEINFAKSIPLWRRGPTIEQAAKLLEIHQDRRKRTDGLRMNVSEGLRALGEQDLQDWEKGRLADLLESWEKGYLQLHDHNVLGALLRSHEIDFPPVLAVNYRLDRDELTSIARQLRIRKRDERLARRAAKSPPPARHFPDAQRGCGNDMTSLMAALTAWEQVVNKAA